MNTAVETKNQNQNRQPQTQTPQRQDRGGQSQPGRPDGRGYVPPAANIAATGNEYILELEMPGVNKEGLEVTVEGKQLTIVGRRDLDIPEGELCYCETPQADFRREFELGPDVDTSKITAEMRQGILTLILPKSEKAKPRQIEVKVA
jgi:HSP20 family protein